MDLNTIALLCSHPIPPLSQQWPTIKLYKAAQNKFSQIMSPFIEFRKIKYLLLYGIYSPSQLLF